MSSSRRLPVVVDVPNPCQVDWEDMVGDERGRHCAQCGKTVRNLSVLEGDEIADVLARGDCVSFLYREDASIVTAESGCGAGTAIGARAAAVVLAATMALTLGCGVKRTGGEPEPVGSAVVGVESEALPRLAGLPSPEQQPSPTAASAAPASSGVAPSSSAAPDPSCAPGTKSVKHGQPAVPSERPRRTAGIPARPRD